MAAKPTLNQGQFELLWWSTARTLGAAPRDTFFGCGRLGVGAAVAAVASVGGCRPHAASVATANAGDTSSSSVMLSLRRGRARRLAALLAGQRQAARRRTAPLPSSAGPTKASEPGSGILAGPPQPTPQPPRCWPAPRCVAQVKRMSSMSVNARLPGSPFSRNTTALLIEAGELPPKPAAFAPVLSSSGRQRSVDRRGLSPPDCPHSVCR